MGWRSRLAAAVGLVVAALVGVTALDVALGRRLVVVEPATRVVPAGTPEPAVTDPVSAAPAAIRTPSASPPTTMATTTTTAPPRSARLLFTGDLLAHTPVTRAAARHGGGELDFAPMFDPVRAIIAGADVAICHMESPVSRSDSDLGSFPIFNAPRSLAEAVAAAGYDGCSTASNHAFDRRIDGIENTLAVFEEVGLRQAGMARSPEEDLAPVLYDAGGITVGHLSATYSLNGFTLPEGGDHLVDLIDPAAILSEAQITRRAGAEFVVLSLHWGSEYVTEPTAQQLAWLAELLPSPDIDLVVGHHAHVVQPIDRVNGEWVVFGLGNFLSAQSPACCPAATQDGVIVEVLLEESASGRIEVGRVYYTPTFVDRPEYRILPVAPHLADAATEGGLRRTLQRSLDRTTAAVASRLGPEDGLELGRPSGEPDGGRGRRTGEDRGPVVYPLYHHATHSGRINRRAPSTDTERDPRRRAGAVR